MRRELSLVHRDRFNLYSRTFQITYLAFLSATLFIKPGHDTVAEGQLFLLEIFFAALVSIFAGFGKVSNLLDDMLFFAASSFQAEVYSWFFTTDVVLLPVLCKT